jgi:hypothetical protein
MFSLNGKPVNIDRPFVTEDGTKYPHLRNPEVRASLGVIETPDETQNYDQRFWWGVGNPKLLEDREEVDENGNPMFVKVLGEVNGEPAMVDSDERLVTKGLKSQWIAQVKDTAGKMLAQTDWMVIRKAERDVAIPESVVATRAAIIAEADRLETAIAGCANVEALIAVVGSQDWPKA